MRSLKGLGLSLSLEEEFKKIDEDFRAQAGNPVCGIRGEFLNGKIMAAYLGYDFVDAASVIRFDKAGNLEAEETNKLLSKTQQIPACGYSGILRRMCRWHSKDIFQRWF